jgi:hypothetical protein
VGGHGEIRRAEARRVRLDDDSVPRLPVGQTMHSAGAITSASDGGLRRLPHVMRCWMRERWMAAAHPPVHRRRTARGAAGIGIRIILVLAFFSATTAVAIAPQAIAGGPAQYSAPDWWPLRGSHVVGCTNGNGCHFNGVDGYHGYWALDIDATRDTDVYAAGAGQVEIAVADQGGNCDFLTYGNQNDCPDGSRGNLVRIRHDAAGQVSTFYLHFSTVFVKTGDWVDQNTLLGKAGDSGLAGAGYVHLHFERRLGNFQVDPVPLRACHGDQLKSYPGEFEGKTSWSQVAAGQYTVRSDGTACAPVTATTAGNSTTSMLGSSTTTTLAPSTTTTTTSHTATIIGRASGYSVPNLTIFGGVPAGVPVPPTPSVALAGDASNSPQTANVDSAAARFGPATIFSSGPITVRSEGSPGAGGSVTSATDIQNVNALRSEVFTASSLKSTCTASATGVSGSTTINRGRLQTSEGDPDVPGDETFVSLPLDPAPNTAFEGRIEVVGDSFNYIFNEQVRNPDGSLTVYAAHVDMLGPTAIGDVYIGRVDCGFPLTATTTTTASTTTTTTTSSTTTTARPTATTLRQPLQLPAHVSAQVCGVLNQWRSLPILSLLIQPLRLMFRCGP